jgi:hypothetical protein
LIPYTYEITALSDDLVATGQLKTADSNGVEALLSFAIDLETRAVRLALASNDHTYVAYNDRLLPASASDDEVGYVFVIPTYEHNVMTEVQVSKHWWSEEDFETFRDSLLDSLLVRLTEAKEQSETLFRNIMLTA